jgi:FdhD protein
MAEERKPITQRPVLCVRAGMADVAGADEIAVEEPLEIRVAGDTLAITMRTPGADRELALGFLLSEGVIASRDDVGRVVHCGRLGDPEFGNVIDVASAPGIALAAPEPANMRRGTVMNSACGVCGRHSIEDLLARCTPMPPGTALSRALLFESVTQLARHQPGFERSGGLHAAAVLAGNGALLVAYEDVGRHNAVDKAIGALVLLGRVPADERVPDAERPSVLAVSGRISFEIVQKALCARLAIVCGVSAPTSLAIDLAQRGRVTLAGFVRGDRLNVYAHAERVPA